MNDSTHRKLSWMRGKKSLKILKECLPKRLCLTDECDGGIQSCVIQAGIESFSEVGTLVRRKNIP